MARVSSDRNKRLRDRQFERILIIKPSSFGDVIHALPVLNGLRRRYPDAHIAWLVANSCAGLLDGHPALDEVIRFDRVRYGKIGRSIRVTGEFGHFVQSLRQRHFDLVIDLQGLIRSGFLAWASGARVRAGFANSRELAWMFYTHRVAVSDAELHAVDRNYLFAEMFGFEDVPITFHLPVQAEAVRSAQALLSEVGWRPDEAYVVIGPGTRWETKLWPAANFAEVARRIIDESGHPVVLIGMPEEMPIAHEVRRAAGKGVIDLTGRTGLQELIALIDGAAGVVMHDSGPMHLAMALNKPMVALYGPTNPQRTGPYRQDNAIIRLALECSPCYIRKLSDCPHDHRCMRDLSVELVMQRLHALLGSEAPAS